MNNSNVSVKKQYKMFSGKVVKISGTKTIRVVVISNYKYPKYGKIILRKKYFLVHDEKSTCSIGDKVEIISCRPISKMKSFRLFKVNI